MSSATRPSRVLVAFCTFNRADRLPALVEALREQVCDERFDLLAVDNNSTDATAQVLQALAARPGPTLRVATETRQGIVPARNRLLEAAAGAEFLLMMDDDELPAPGWVQAGLRALRDEGCDCAGGRIRVSFEPHGRPSWLADELLGFLAEVDHGDRPFRITDKGTAVWTANVGYRMALFDGGLRFDARYNRAGNGSGGGEDVVMFETLLDQGHHVGYRPDMVVQHHVEAWRLHRRYFLRLHFASGVRAGRYTTDVSGRQLAGAPLYLFPQALRQLWRTLRLAARGERAWLRQGMNFMHACGRIVGTWRKARSRPAPGLTAP